MAKRSVLSFLTSAKPLTLAVPNFLHFLHLYTKFEHTCHITKFEPHGISMGILVPL